MIGRTISHYRILEKLGQGGMGVVYKAEDLALKRPVALKFFTEGGLSTPDRRARFLREARLAAALNHPSLCTIHEVAEIQPEDAQQIPAGEPLSVGTPFLVMEFIDGPSLGDVLRKSRDLPLSAALKIAVQVAEGLVAVHERKIVHRDLKPGNVMLTSDGRVKLLDFGLAKHLGPTDPADAVLAQADTVSEELTRAGMVVGTVAYMSPEQAQGLALDSRSDIFSFGIMLYEMVVGTRPFRGETSESTRLKIIESEPESVPESHKDIPLELERIIHRCLRKKPVDRYNDTRDLVVALRDLHEETTSGHQRRIVSRSGERAISFTGERPGVAEQQRSLWQRVPGWAMVTLGVLFAGLVAVLIILSSTGRDPGQVRIRPPSYRQITFTGVTSGPEISPDGLAVAYVQEVEGGGCELLVQDLAGGEPLSIHQSESIIRVRWAPGGTELLVTSKLGRKHAPLLVPRLGGTPRMLPQGAGWISWSPDGRRYTGAGSPSKEITIFDVTAGEVSTVPLSGSFVWLWDVDWSPFGDRLAFLTKDDEDRAAIWTISTSGEEQRKVVEEASVSSTIRWSGDGDAIYYMVRDEEISDLWKVQIDPGSGRPRADPSVVLSGLEVAGEPFRSRFSISRDGTKFVYAELSSHSNLWLVTPGGDEVSAEKRQLTFGTFRDGDFAVSPDGGQIAFVRRGNIHVMRLGGGAMRQLTFFSSRTSNPSWSPDGRRIAFGSAEGGRPRVWMIPAEGGTPRQYKGTRLSQNLYVTWAPGAKILYQTVGNRNFHLLDPETEAETSVMRADSVGWAFDACYSPDGTAVAVYWNRTQPDGDRRTNVWTVSLADSSEVRIADAFLGVMGGIARWSSDGEWVYGWDSSSDPGRGIRIPATGGEAEAIFDWPFPGREGFGIPNPDASQWVCKVGESRSDIWLVENFDSDIPDDR